MKENDAKCIMHMLNPQLKIMFEIEIKFKNQINSYFPLQAANNLTNYQSENQNERNPEKSNDLSTFLELTLAPNTFYISGFQAKRLSNGEFAAIKVIKLEPGDDFGVIQQEILVMKDCRHPNIVAYYGSYLRRDRLWICMEFCGGGSLQDIYHSKFRLSDEFLLLAFGWDINQFQVPKY